MIAPALPSPTSPQGKTLQYRTEETPTIPSSHASASSIPPLSKSYIIPSYNQHQNHQHLEQESIGYPVNLPPISGEYQHPNLPRCYPYHPSTFSQPPPTVNHHLQNQNSEYHSPIPTYPHAPRHAYPPGFGAHPAYHHPESKPIMSGPDGTNVQNGVSAPNPGLHPHHMVNNGLGLAGPVNIQAAAPTPASRRLAHIQSEQKRRESINCGFDDLKRAVPSTHSSDSKAVVLRKAVQYVQQLQSELERLYEHTGIEPPMYRTFSPLQNDHHHHYADYGEYRGQRQQYYPAPMYRTHSRPHPDPGSSNHSPEGSVSPNGSSSRRMMPIGSGALIPQFGPMHTQALHHHPGHTIPPPDHDAKTEPTSENPQYEHAPSSYSPVQNERRPSNTPHVQHQPSGPPLSGTGAPQNSQPSRQSQSPSEQQQQQQQYPTDAQQSHKSQSPAHEPTTQTSVPY